MPTQTVEFQLDLDLEYMGFAISGTGTAILIEEKETGYSETRLVGLDAVTITEAGKSRDATTPECGELLELVQDEMEQSRDVHEHIELAAMRAGGIPI